MHADDLLGGVSSYRRAAAAQLQAADRRAAKATDQQKPAARCILMTFFGGVGSSYRRAAAAQLQAAGCRLPGRKSDSSGKDCSEMHSDDFFVIRPPGCKVIFQPPANKLHP